ncbi:phosphatidylinositol-4- kinase [Coelomomyces lativittatus]|nr:phosphatidylinositol-4- kinase [Coelomomyces lativittatus]
MAESGLPCFKSEQTLKKLRSRFVLDRNQREAAAYMTDRINDSYKNWRTVAYDKFQNMQSGIPF